jgi:Asp-tRNA(Asn)/Glu-tRNA(Gln) amidotransferase A subunit family amidase
MGKGKREAMVARANLVEVAAALREGRVSSHVYTEQLLARIRERDPAIDAWVTLDEARALRLADECDARRAGVAFQADMAAARARTSSRRNASGPQRPGIASTGRPSESST